MSRLERISQVCLYMGALLLVLFMDWCWYAKHYPLGNRVLRVEFFPGIYMVFVAAMAICFGLAVYFNRKSRPKQMGHGERRKNRRK